MKSHGSMNRIYRLVWNSALSIWVAVAEKSRGRGKAGPGRSSVTTGIASSGFTLKSACRAALGMFAALALFTTQVHAGPAGGIVSAGTGAIVQSGTTTTINQASQRLAIDWNTFSTAAGESVVFAQPNAQAIALNRVLGSSPSELLGSLSANGQVFILNPNGVLFGAGSQVNVGGLVASTLSMSNADFMAGKNVFTKEVNSTGTVINRGTLTAADGGYIALLAPQVRNEGVISATLGTALLAAGNKVTLNLNNGSLLGYSIDQGALNALADNQQLIQANGGQVLMSAKAADALSMAVVNNTGVIEAKTLQNQSGRILLMGDMASGQVNVAGKLDASAPNGGDGGFIETSATHVKVAEGTAVTTAAPQGKAGTWLIDPTDYTIAATDPGNGSSYMSNGTLEASLGSGNVIIQTLATGAGNGDIFVNDAVTWNSSNSLTLNAVRDVNVNATIKSSVYISGTNPGNAGDVAINAGRDIVLGVAGTAIDASVGTDGGGTTTGRGGDVTLTAGGRISGASSGISTNVYKYQAGGTGSRGGNVAMTANGGDVSIGAINTSTSQNDAGGAVGNAGNVTISASGSITVNAITARANGPANNSGTTTVGNGGTVSLIAKGGGVTINGAIDVRAIQGVATSVGQGGTTFIRADANGTCLSTSVNCSTVVFGGVGSVTTSGTGRTDIYYNPTTYAAPTDYSAQVSGASTAWMLVNDVGSEIGGVRGLQAINTNLAGSYAVGKNVEASSSSGWNAGEGFVPIGNGAQFTGNFDGLGRTINNLTINRPSTTYVGLFGSAGVGSVIKNAGMVGGSVSGSQFVGALVGYNNGTISNSSATGTVSGQYYTGGLVGYNGGTISNSSGAGTVSGYDYTGGLAGWNQGVVNTSYGAGSVTGQDYAGGLVGVNYNGSISNAYATGDVSAYYSAGGLVGYSSGSINATYAKGRVSGTYYQGGLAGTNYGSISSSYWDTQTSGQSVATGNGSSGGATGLTTAQALTQSSYSGFDFTNSWKIAAGQNGGYPQLIWQVSPFTTITYLFPTITSLTYSGIDQLLSTLFPITFGGTTNTLVAGTDYNFTYGGNTVTSFRNAGTYSDISISLLNTSYQLASTGNTNGSLTINPFAVNLTGTRTYDGTANVSAASLSIGTLVGSETLVLSGEGAVADKNVGAARQLTLGTLALGNGTGLASNYSFTGGMQTADITQRALTVTATGINKIYDGNTTAVVTLADNRIAGDILSIGSSASFLDKNVAAGKAVNVTGIALSSTDAGNYTVNTTASASADITQRALTVLATVANKVYDGNTTAAVTLADNRVAGDALTLTDTAANFANKNAGAAKAVSVTGINVAGTDASNYTFNTTANTTASITPKTLTATANNDSKFYDGAAYSGGNGVTLNGFVAGDTATDITGSPAYSGSSQGAVAPGRYVITPGGLSSASGNYAPSYVDGSLAVNLVGQSNAALGTAELVTAYESVLQHKSAPARPAAPQTPETTERQRGNSLVDVVNCGVLMPQGVNVSACQ